jgi:Tfp pilus assembly protein PilN
MTTLCANLIPRRRRAAQEVAARARLWTGVLSGALALAGIAYGVMMNMVGGDAADTRTELARVEQEIEAANTELTRARAELGAATGLLVAAQEVRDHPDFSLLLDALAARRSEDVVLGSVELIPRDIAASRVFLSRPSGYTLRLSGLARDHGAATAFSLMLERTGIFSRVTILDSSSEKMGEKAVVAFGVECSLDESGSPLP